MEFEARTREGLIKGHAYTITGMRIVSSALVISHYVENDAE